MEGRIVVAVSVYRYYSVCVFRYNLAVRVHTEGSYQVVVLVCLVYDFAFVNIICDVLEHLCRKLNSDSDVHTVLFQFYSELVAYC